MQVRSVSRVAHNYLLMYTSFLSDISGCVSASEKRIKVGILLFADVEFYAFDFSDCLSASAKCVTVDTPLFAVEASYVYLISEQYIRGRTPLFLSCL